MPRSYAPISHYGVIGNLHTAALVCKDGGLDFLSFPRFDSPTVFAKLLDAERGGAWTITPHGVEELRTEQYYEPDTAILVTRYMHASGIVEVLDFMPPVDEVAHCQVVRTVRALVGKTRLRFTLAPRYPYGSEASSVGAEQDGGGRTVDLGPHPTVLYGANGDEGSPPGTHLRFDFDVAAGADDGPPVRSFIFQSDSCRRPGEEGVLGFGESLLAYTRDYWCAWIANVAYEGIHRDVIRRSAITLKLCTSAEFGSSVAAPTFGLPEEIGGERNWDYRYSWVRDSAFTMYAFIRLGLKEEARKFMGWIEERCTEIDEAGDLELMYRVDGTLDLDEYELDLEGYEQSSPVRVGNGAKGQRQLDIYGELIDTVYLYDGHAHEITYQFWTQLTKLVDYVCETWRQPDHGIWEVRSGKQQFTMSKVMAWVAIDRGVRIAQHRGFPAPMERWFKERNDVYEAIYEQHYDTDMESWTQYPGSGELDGSLLMMPLVRFAAPQEPNWLKTLGRIEEHLVDDCLVKRYEPGDGSSDGLSGGEG